MTELARAREVYDALVDKGLSLDMTRGKPGPEQLILSEAMLSVLGPEDLEGEGGDYRNYGLPAGIPEARHLFAGYFGVGTDEVIVGGNSSLQLMHYALSFAVAHGVPGGEGPWGPGTKVICPVPGYDRHFALCESLGLEMVTVPMTKTGPDLEAVRELVKDPSVKAMWNVPKYSNPTGVTYADATVIGLATMETAAPDFRLLWDNAYNVHHLGGGPAPLQEVVSTCAHAGHANRPLVFGSTSKITLPGAGVAAFASSTANVDDMLQKLSFVTIGPDKLNQLRHVRFFGDLAGIEAHMDRHAALLTPKFAAVERALSTHLSGLASWTAPRGGYFVSVDVPSGCARRTVELAAGAGVKLTPAGSTWPGGVDPEDRNLRLAPTLPPLERIEQAMEVFCACVALAAAERDAG